MGKCLLSFVPCTQTIQQTGASSSFMLDAIVDAGAVQRLGLLVSALTVSTVQGAQWGS